MKENNSNRKQCCTSTTKSKCTQSQKYKKRKPQNKSLKSSTTSFRYDTYLELQSTAPVCPLTTPSRNTKHTGTTMRICLPSCCSSV